MNKHRRIIAFTMAVLLCIGAVFCTSAAHRDTAEISAKTGLEPVGTFFANAALSTEGDTLPSRYSSKEEGLTLQIRTQHSDTCWAFGSLSTFETLLLNNNESNVKILAPEHANYWGSKREDGTGWQRDPNSAGYSFIPLGYLTSWAGPVNEADFPENQSTKEDYNAFTKTPAYGLTSAVYFDNTTDKNVIKEYIFNYGSVVASFNSDTDYLADNKAFYCSDSSIEISALKGHCVSIVGWDDNYSKDNFSGSKSGTPSKDGAWLMKNSWGEYIGEEGYMWISYEDVWLFNDIFGPSYALTGYEPICEDVKLYQNEVDGATYEYSYLYSDSITFINAFDFEKDNRNLDKVVFESTCLNGDYTIYYIPFDGNKPTNNRAVWEELCSGVVDYTGYICADIEDVKLPEGKGAIGVHIKDSKEDIATIGVCEWLINGDRKIFLPQAEKGLSYIMDMNSYTNKIHDVMDIYSDELKDEIGGTFVIKAITRNECSAPHPTEPEETTVTTAPETTVPATTVPATTVPATTMQTDPTEATTVPSTTVPASTTIPVTSIPVTTIPVTSIPAVTTLPLPTVTVPVVTTVPVTSSAASTDATEEITTESIPATTVTIPATTVTVPFTTTLPPETSTFDIAEPFVYKLGDADLSGVVNIKDATQIQKHAAMLLTLTSRELMAADVNKNGDANVVDATYIQKFAANIKTDILVGKECIFFE